MVAVGAVIKVARSAQAIEAGVQKSFADINNMTLEGLLCRNDISSNVIGP